MIVSLYWLEPEEGSWIVSVVDMTEDELRDVQKWARKEAGNEWGVTIPSVRLTSGEADAPNRISAADLASAIRYDTGEEAYSKDCPVFKKRGIVRS